MNILYFHGLDRPADAIEQNILSAHGKLILPNIDYSPDANFIAYLKKIYHRKNITVIIGSSMGGLVAYALSCQLNKPCLIFNPTLGYADIMEYDISSINRSEFLKVVLGSCDDVVDYRESIRILEEKNRGYVSLNIDFKLKAGIKHTIPVIEFKKEVDDFFHQLNSFKKAAI